MKIVKTWKEVHEEINEGDIYIVDKQELLGEKIDFRYQVDIAGERIIANFLEVDNAIEYAEFLQSKINKKEEK